MSNTPDDTPLAERSSEALIAADWDADPENAFIWIAWISSPGLPEPHCYSGGIHRTGEDAIALVQTLQDLRGDAMTARLRELITSD